jgi:hypothetical protein
MCPAKEYPWLPKEGQYVLVRLGSKRESALRISGNFWVMSRCSFLRRWWIQCLSRTSDSSSAWVRSQNEPTPRMNLMSERDIGFTTDARTNTGSSPRSYLYIRRADSRLDPKRTSTYCPSFGSHGYSLAGHIPSQRVSMAPKGRAVCTCPFGI